MNHPAFTGMKIFSKLDALGAHPRLASIAAAERVTIDGVAYPGLKELLARASSPEGLKRIAPTLLNLAEVEGLRAHAHSIRVRYAGA